MESWGGAGSSTGPPPPVPQPVASPLSRMSSAGACSSASASFFGAQPGGSGSHTVGHLSPGVGGSTDAQGGLSVEQSPAARASKAHSDALSEIDSWRDDASSSLATCSAGDRTVTVNTQRLRMGEHLKGKLQHMLRQRFDNYLGIIQTLQNGTGKLTTLECELRSPCGVRESKSALTSIYCNEDGTFLVALVAQPQVPDPGPAALGSGSPSQGGPSEPVPKATAPLTAADAAAAVVAASSSSCPPQSPSPGSGGRSSEVVAPAPATMAQEVAQSSAEPAMGVLKGADGTDGASLDAAVQLSRKWVEQVCEFGMSGRCHSLTALFHFGYTTWKQLCGDKLVASLDGRPGHIAEEEELHAAAAGARDPMFDIIGGGGPGSGIFPLPSPASAASVGTCAAVAAAPVVASTGGTACCSGAPVAAVAMAAGGSPSGGAVLGAEGTGCSILGGSPLLTSAPSTSSPCNQPIVGGSSASAGSGSAVGAAPSGDTGAGGSALGCASPGSVTVAAVGQGNGGGGSVGPVAPGPGSGVGEGSCGGGAGGATGSPVPSSGIPAPAVAEEGNKAPLPPPDVESVLRLALLAADDGQCKQALELCNDGIALAQRATRDAPAAAAAVAATASSSSAKAPMLSSSSSAATGSIVAFQGVDPAEDEAATVVWQFLSLRANVQVRLRNYNFALQDAEELIALQPTCAEGYYWQSTALQGMGRSQEALEALMSALEYEPQNSLFQQAFTQLFEEISASSTGRGGSSSMAVGRTGSRTTGGSAGRASAAARGSPTRSPPSAVVLQRRARGGALGDALSTTTQATHLSSRSTTPTEVSERLSRSSSNDSVYEDAT